MKENKQFDAVISLEVYTFSSHLCPSCMSNKKLIYCGRLQNLEFRDASSISDWRAFLMLY